MKTSHALNLSSCGLRGGVLGGRERGGLAVGLPCLQAVVQDADEPVEQVALGGGVPFAGGSASVVVGPGPGEAVSAEKAHR